jgi:(R,R)-butanediol dehydrogenase/meso-butanediol dehydrogenase/diacetyl reductase
VKLQARYVGHRTFELKSVERPKPASGQVLIDVAYTGLCGTDLHIFHGDMDPRVAIPAVLGHEMSGRIAAIGAHVTDWAVGDPVTVMPLRWCGECPGCRAGYHHICHRLVFLGIDADGAMQASWEVPADILIALPADLSLRAAALIEPTAVAVHDVSRAGVQAGEHVVVVGGGPVGTLIALVARNAGADVVLVEPDQHRRSIAEGLGLSALDPGSVDVVHWVDDWTSSAGATVSFEVSGAAAGVATAVEVLATRGRLCLVAIHAVPREVNLHRFFWRELSLVAARLYERADYQRAVELVASGVVPVDALISKVVGLGEVADAFAAIEAGGAVMKVLIDCQREQTSGDDGRPEEHVS